MKRSVKTDNLSIRWKIFTYMAFFIGLLILLLWLFQTVLLDSFYKAIKSRSIKNIANQIALNIDSENMNQTLLDISRKHDMCIRILDESYDDVYSVDIMHSCSIHHVPDSLLEQYYTQAKNNGDAALAVFPKDSVPKNDINFTGRVRGGRQFGEFMPPPFRKDNRSMIYVKMCRTSSDEQRIILVNAMISPLDATVNTLRIQLICITVIFFILTMIISFVMSRKISKPIVRINDSAKELAKGNYATQFHGSGYKEISELNSTLNYAANELSKVEVLRRELLANISHDLRTPLTMITGYGEIMRDIPGENTPDNVQIIIDEARRLSELVDDILDYSKLQAGEQKLALSQFNITEDIRNIIKRFSKFTQANGYTLEFIYDTDVSIHADDLKISQVVYNLISNAINYAGEDKKITVKQIVSDTTVRIQVADNGKGISEEQLPYVWDRYYKTDKSLKRSDIGSGLGLAIVKAILDLHKAEYGVESRIGQGSTFWFEFAIAKDC